MIHSVHTTETEPSFILLGIVHLSKQVITKLVKSLTYRFSKWFRIDLLGLNGNIILHDCRIEKNN